MRRCVISITSNIAEGFSRRSVKDKKHFYVMAQGSLTELQNQLLASRDLEYIAKQVFDDISQDSISAHKILTGLIKATSKMKRS